MAAFDWATTGGNTLQKGKELAQLRNLLMSNPEALAKMMPGSGGGLGLGAGLGAGLGYGGAGLLGAATGGYLANEAVVGRGNNEGENNRFRHALEASPNDLNIRKVFDREQARLGKHFNPPTPNVSTPRENDFSHEGVPSDITPDALIKLLSSSRGSSKSGGGGGAQKTIDDLLEQIRQAGRDKAGFARGAAGKMRMPETAEDKAAYLAALRDTPVAKGDWWKPISQALAGGFVDPNSDNPFGKFGMRATKAVTDDEALRKAERDKALMEKITGIKFGASDRASRDALSEAMNAQTNALAGADMMVPGAVAEAAKLGIPAATDMARIAETRRSSEATAQRQGLPNQLREYITLLQASGDKRGVTALAQEFLNKARQQKTDTLGDRVKLEDAFKTSGLPSNQKAKYTAWLMGEGTSQEMADYGRRMDAYAKTQNPKVFD
jgi:hypothetical protein